MVYTLVLEASAERIVSSSLTLGTKYKKGNLKIRFPFFFKHLYVGCGSGNRTPVLQAYETCVIYNYPCHSPAIFFAHYFSITRLVAYRPAQNFKINFELYLTRQPMF